MGYVDLIPDVFRLTMPDLATGKSYHTQKFNVGNKQCIGVTIKASQALSVAVAYGIATDTAAAAGVDIAASLPYKTSATSFASNTSTEGGTYHEIAVPPHARQAQLVISNASGSTVSGAVIDAALRVVAYPAASGSGSSDFASITGWPGSSSQFVHADGSYSPLSAADIPTLTAAQINTPIDAGTTGGTSTAYTASLPTAPASYDTGLTITVKFHTASGASPTINLNSLGAKAIYKMGPSGSIAAVGAGGLGVGSYILRYNGTQFAVLGQGPITAGDMPAALEFVAVVANSQSVTSGSAGKMNLDTATINTVGTVSSSVITIGAGCGGEYHWECSLLGNNSNVANLELDVNGSRFCVGIQSVSNQGFRGAGSVKLAAGDAVTLKAGSGGGTTINTGAAGYQTFRMVRKL